MISIAYYMKLRILFSTKKGMTVTKTTHECLRATAICSSSVKYLNEAQYCG